MSVIAIDTASRHSAWILRATVEGEVIDRRGFPGGELDRRLPADLSLLLDDDVKAVVVLMGPGSYSGVRAGMAAALGLADARRLPLHGLGNLTAVAVAAEAAGDAVFSAVADAGRGGVYVAAFTGCGLLTQEVSPVRRTTVGAVVASRRLFATAEIPGLLTELLDPVLVLAAAVPRALAAAPLAAAGLRALHADSVDSATPHPPATAP